MEKMNGLGQLERVKKWDVPCHYTPCWVPLSFSVLYPNVISPYSDQGFFLDQDDLHQQGLQFPSLSVF